MATDKENFQINMFETLHKGPWENETTRLFTTTGYSASREQ